MDDKMLVAEILKEVGTLGDNVSGMRKTYETLNKNYELLKGVIGDDDYLARMKGAKLAHSIALMQERMDMFEVASKRPGMANLPSSAGDEAQTFYKHMCSINNKKVDKEHIYPTEKFQAYKEVFDKWLEGGCQEALLTPEEQKTLIVGSDPDGGYLVTPSMSNRIITRLYESDPIRQLCSVEYSTSGSREWIVDADDSGAEWESETVASTDRTTPNVRKKRITAHALGTRPLASQELIEDSMRSIETWLSNKCADKFNRTEGAAFVTGNGVGKPRGFATYANGTSWGQVEQVNMGAAAALTADGFYSVKYALIEQYLNRATWLMNRSTFAAALKLKDGSGNYLWQPSYQLGQPSTLIGLPVRMSTTMPAVAASALSVALADWEEAYMIVDRIGISLLRDPYTAKPLVEYYFRKRVGGDVTNYTAIKLGKISA